MGGAQSLVDGIIERAKIDWDACAVNAIPAMPIDATLLFTIAKLLAVSSIQLSRIADSLDQLAPKQHKL